MYAWPDAHIRFDAFEPAPFRLSGRRARYLGRARRRQRSLGPRVGTQPRRRPACGRVGRGRRGRAVRDLTVRRPRPCRRCGGRARFATTGEGLRGARRRADPSRTIRAEPGSPREVQLRVRQLPPAVHRGTRRRQHQAQSGRRDLPADPEPVRRAQRRLRDVAGRPGLFGRGVGDERPREAVQGSVGDRRGTGRDVPPPVSRLLQRARLPRAQRGHCRRT